MKLNFSDHGRLLFATMIMAGAFMVSCSTQQGGADSHEVEYPAEFTLSKTDLMDKIKGGWAGQVIGCTYGGPTEFRFKGDTGQPGKGDCHDRSRYKRYLSCRDVDTDPFDRIPPLSHLGTMGILLFPVFG